MIIKFIYNLESELEVVIYTLKSADFFIKNNYAVSLPQKIKLGEPCNREDIISALEIEMWENKKEYQEIEKRIKDFWKSKKTQIDEFFNIFKYKYEHFIPQSVEVILTRYGPGGYYRLPNRVILRTNQNFGVVSRSPEETLIHEIIHLILEVPVVKKMNLDHEEKENLVESFFEEQELKDIFPNHLFSPNYKRTNIAEFLK